MLQSVRNNLKGVVAYIIIGIIIVPFALFGVEALVSGKNSLQRDSIAEINGKKVSELDFRRALEMQRQRFRQMLGDKIDPKYLSDEFLGGSVQEGLIEQRLLETAADQAQLRVGDDVIDRQIVADKTFQREGKFDKEQYTRILTQFAYTPASYREELKEGYLREQYQNAFTQTAFTTEREISDQAQLQFQKRTFDFLVLPMAKALAAVSVTDDELTAFYKEHQDRFMSDEQVAVDYLVLRKQDLAAAVDVTEADIHKQYEAEIAKSAEKAERHAAHILVAESDQAKLPEIQQRLAKGEDFAALAKQYSIDTGSAQQGGDVGVTTGNSFVPEFEAALTKLKVGEVSAPVKTRFGYHIIKLLSVKEVKPKTYAESRQRIVDEMKLQLADEQYKDKLEVFRDAAHAATDLNTVAGKLTDEHFKPAVQQSGLFSRKTVPAILANRDLQSALFAPGIQTGTVTDVVETSKGVAVVARVTQSKAPEVRPFAEVKGQVVEMLRHDKAVAALASQSKTLVSRLNSGETIPAIAKATGTTAQTKTDKMRDDTDTDRTILQKVFAMPHPVDGEAVVETLDLPTGDIALISLRAVTTPAAETLAPEQLNQVASRMNGAKSGTANAIMQAALMADAKIIRNKLPTRAPATN